MTRSFIVCDYLDRQGRRIERIFITMSEDARATDRLRAEMKEAEFDDRLAMMKVEGLQERKATNLHDAALALNALLNEIEQRRTNIADAARIASISVDFRKPAGIPDIMPVLEATFGGYAVSWARGVFARLRLGTPHLH